jgi:hypothetical protein
MNGKFFGTLPDNYQPLKDWRLLLIFLTALLALFDVIYFPVTGADILLSITSAILLFFFVYELVHRLKFMQTKLGYNSSLILVFIYIVSDIIIYFGS